MKNNESIQPGDIVLAHFPFAEKTTKKLRPALVLNVGIHGIILVSYMTSRRPSSEFTLSVKPGTISGLSVTSFVLLNKLTTITTENVVRSLGEISKSERSGVRDKLTLLASSFITKNNHET